MTILGVEAAEEVEHLAGLTNGLADVVQGIGELLEPPGVRGDVHVTLKKIPELGFEVDSTVQLVVPELVVDGVPDRVRRSPGCADDGADILGDGVVDPAQQAVIADDPVRVATVGRGGRGRQMRTEPELPNEGVEEAAPLRVVRVGDAELDGNVNTDVHRL